MFNVCGRTSHMNGRGKPCIYQCRLELQVGVYVSNGNKQVKSLKVGKLNVDLEGVFLKVVI